MNRLISENDTEYAFDDFGNRLTMSDGEITTTYSYDLNNRLIKEEYTDEADEPYFNIITKEYEYSPNGNLHSKIQTIITETGYFYSSEFNYIKNETNQKLIAENIGRGVLAYYSSK